MNVACVFKVLKGDEKRAAGECKNARKKYAAPSTKKRKQQTADDNNNF